MILASHHLPDEIEFNQSEPELILLFEYLQRQKRYKIMEKKHHRFSAQELADDSQAIRLIMQTHIGHRIMYLMSLRGQIESRKKKRSMNLANLMKRKE